MGFTLFLWVWVAANGYIAWRASSVPWVARHVPAWAIVAGTLLLASGYILARLSYSRGLRWPGAPLEFVGANWVGVAFYLLLCLLVVDVVTGFGFFAPRLASPPPCGVGGSSSGRSSPSRPSSTASAPPSSASTRSS